MRICPSELQNAFRGDFFFPFYKFRYSGKRKSNVQITPDFCMCRKTRITARYKFRYSGKRILNLQIDLKTTFEAPKSLSKLQNHFQSPFKASKQVSNLKSVSKPVQSLKTSFKHQISFQSPFKAPKPLSTLQNQFQGSESLSN